jgi:hypothetical protein
MLSIGSARREYIEFVIDFRGASSMISASPNCGTLSFARRMVQNRMPGALASYQTAMKAMHAQLHRHHRDP